MNYEIIVKVIWDTEAKVWVAQSDNIQGLITEAETMETLIQKLKIMIPELLEANSMMDQDFKRCIPFHIFGKRSETIDMAA
ncbi:MAG: DUF1902 domain-containing protein [Desulfamplus sp.]|nr:DUF1902 domain-containing protein [Desulfamplus sp.]